MHKGLVGAGNLNIELQNVLNPEPDNLTRGGKNFRINDKVMQIRNNYEKEVFNGDLGRIIKIDLEAQEVIIDFDGSQVAYDYSDLDEVVPAYAISIHKSQGSEYPIVILPVLNEQKIMLQRRLLYTAITRASKSLILIGEKSAFAYGLSRKDENPRKTYLLEYLCE